MKSLRKLGLAGFLFNALCVFFMVEPAAIWAAAPSLFFSDLTDGPTSGWNGSASQGAAISIWGTNLGTSRGNATLTICGVTLNQDSQFAEWGATTNPMTARGLQRITFWLNSSMTTAGTAPNSAIQVNVGNVHSNAIPFHCRALGGNHIYFLSPSGSDSNAGSLASPWKTGQKIRTSLQAGDIAYLRGGVYLSVDANWSADQADWIQFWCSGAPYQSGTAYNSIGVISYPGEAAQIGDGSLYYAGNNTSPNHLVDHLGSAGCLLNYWTFSKLTSVIGLGAWHESLNVAGSGDAHLRWTGNYFRQTAASLGEATFDKEGNGQGSTYNYMLGNYFYKIGVPLPPAAPPADSAGSSTGLTGTYSAKYTYASYSSGLTGALMQESDLSTAGNAVSLANQSLHVCWPQPPADRQANAAVMFTAVRIYRTKAGGGAYYYDQDVPIGNNCADSTAADSALSSRTTIEGGYRDPAVYYGGYGFLDHIYFMFNECDQINGNPIQNYGHVYGDYIDHFHIAYNYIHDSGTSVYDHRPAIVTGGGDGGTTPYQYVRNEYIYNNVVVNEWSSAIRVAWGGGGGGGGGITNGVFANNTFYWDAAHAAADCCAMQIGGTTNTGFPINVKFENNIVYFPGSASGGQLYNTSYYGSPQNSTVGLTGDHNFWYGLGAGACAGDYRCSPLLGGGDFDNGANPNLLSVSPATCGDVALAAGSPAIDAGANASAGIAELVNDFLGVARPQGAAYDIGAFEYISGSGQTLALPPASPRGFRLQ